MNGGKDWIVPFALGGIVAVAILASIKPRSSEGDQIFTNIASSLDKPAQTLSKVVAACLKGESLKDKPESSEDDSKEAEVKEESSAANAGTDRDLAK